MGIYLNPGNQGFREAVSSQIYVDKTEMISYTNRVLGTKQKYVCVSRPRRFGKSMAAEMLTAYYEKDSDSDQLFENLKIKHDVTYETYKNKYSVVFLNIQNFLSRTHDITKLKSLIEKSLLRELKREYIVLNYDGLKDSIVELLSGGRKKINTNTFSNDMTTFHTADDVLTLLIHLGYLGYDFSRKEIFIPNSEIASEFCNAIEAAGWKNIVMSIKKSDTLLQDTWDKKNENVALGISEAHMETSILTYNDENALSYTIALAYYSAREYYQIFRELPAGKRGCRYCIFAS